MKEDKQSFSSSTEVKHNGIAFRLNWAVVQYLVFWGLLLGGVLVLAMNGELLMTVLKELIGTVIALYLGKTCL